MGLGDAIHYRYNSLKALLGVFIGGLIPVFDQLCDELGDIGDARMDIIGFISDSVNVLKTVV